MIRKLRLKFVLFTMTIVTLLLVVIFGLVFYFTRANLEQKSIDMMESIATHPFQLGIPSELGEEVRLPYFTLQVGPAGELIATGGGYYDLSDLEFLHTLIDAVFESPRPLGVIEAYHLRYYRLETPYRQCLVFVDISSELATLQNLVRTCVILGLVSFLAFLWVSILLSKWAVGPVERAMQQQREFVAAASHELKTPLAVITTSAELLQTPGFSQNDKAGFLENVLAMSRQMRALVEQLLELARAEQGLDAKTFTPVDLSRLVERGTLPFEALFFERGLRLETAIAPGLRVRGQADRLGAVLEVLLDNARKYASPGGAVWVRLQPQGWGRCRLSVANEGQPLSPEALAAVFKRFYRADPARSRDGSYGLGLSIAQAIVQAHGGKIWAESSDGVNRFLVELPLLTAKAQQSAEG